MSEIHPALQAAQNSWKAVQSSDKEAWLGLMADDICIEDPIGEAVTNPTGLGVQGKEAVSKFYDQFIGPASIVVETHMSRAAGNESAHVLTLHTTLANGVTTHVHGIFTYLLNDAGLLTNLRGYWTMADMSVDQPDA
ncbi:MAG: nuclear transport factor 2 family protein [Myxococcota bacterium]|jgi:steroid delta-isomerase|nr:nuclear transport factor 2 family protein [Myxococcota bacterium]